ncbi:hypothetical protein [Chitinophaga skermanii]|uniref:hypothetical protein n=1 Tax=Chitinophaga skermanii TaxID=331697 RepID=UPI0011E5B1EF|nr:hypothetical protein [Chitinophaga skermanii]
MFITDYIYKAEVSLFKKEEYKQIESNEFLKILQASKGAFVKFKPYSKVKLYAKNDTIYNIYFSQNNQYFKIAGSTYSLPQKQIKKISELFNF